MLNFTKVDRNNPSKRGVMERIKDFDEVYNVFDKNKAEEQAERCIGCGDPYCHNKCPLHNIIPAWLKQTAQNDIELAFNISNETSPFPEILGRICPQDVLCEGDCTLNDTHGAITIGAVETHISETGFEKGLKPKFSKEKIGKKVAVIGSGPAGISVATFLLRAGVDVDMFERANRAGGLLTYGIPGFKLDKFRVQRRINWLVEAGMTLHTGCEIGKDKSFEELENSYDAVFLGIGATKGKMPNIDGQNNDNVYLAMDFLTGIQKRNFLEESDKHKDEKGFDFIDVKDKNVVVIGGGDTAMDCVRTSIREGASNVKCLYRRDESNMPGSKKEVINSKEEGVEFIFNVSPKSITSEGVEVLKTQMTQADETGRQSVQIIENSEYIEAADIVILALGFDQELPPFIQESGLELDRWNGLKVNEQYQTSNSKIYAGGDSVRGADLAVTAAADGKVAAKFIINSFKA
jgi:glutamate synthase (NADPH/NADH) small chain